MNENEIDALEAGRKVDGLIAEKVMGLTVVWNDYRTDVLYELPVRRTLYSLEPGRVREYSADIAAAWQVIEKFRRPQLRKLPNNNWLCSVDSEDWTLYVGEAATPALAICRAALKAVEANVEDE